LTAFREEGAEGMAAILQAAERPALTRLVAPPIETNDET
jgi:hypothetical protein